jgi:lambda family phage tail tape measure protein
MANMIARLGVVLGLDGAEFEQGIRKAERAVGDFAEKTAQMATTVATVLGTAFVGASIAAMHLADEIDDVAKANEVTIDTILKLNNALDQNGGHSENAGKMLAHFNAYIDKAAGGSEEAQAKLAKLGISLQDLASMGAEQLFLKVADGLAQMSDQISRSATQQEIFGKSVRSVDIVGFAADMQKSNEVTERAASGIRDLADIFDALKKQAHETSVILQSELGPQLKVLFEYISGMKGQDDFLRELLRSFLQYTIGTIGTLVMFGKVAIDTIVGLGQAGFAVIKGDFAALGNIFETTKNKIKADFEEYKQFVAKLDKAVNEPTINRQEAKSVGREVVSAEELKRQKELDALLKRQRADAERRAEQEQRELERYLEMLQRNADAMDKMQQDETARLEAQKQIADVEGQIGVLTTEEISRRKELIQLTYEHERAINKIKDTLMDNDRKESALMKEDELFAQRLALSEQKLSNTQAANANSLRISQNLQRDRLEMEKELLLVDANFGRKRAEEVTHARELLQIEFDRKKAIDEINRMNLSGPEKQAAIQRETENAAAKAELANTKLEIARAKREGTFMEGFKNKMFDAVRDMPTELEKGEQFFESVMSNMENALSNFIKTGKLNFKDFARSIIQDLLMIQMKSQMVSIFKSFLGDYNPAEASGVSKFLGMLPGLAGGGDMMANRPYLVGEQGPEIVVPRQSGTVIPNNRMGSVGGTTNVTNYNIQAIDTKSFEERIYGSASAVWAANQYATRALPTSAGRI